MVSVELGEVLLAGYTGRNRESVLRHIRELDAIGVAPPPRVPMIYPVLPELLTVGSSIVVHGDQTSGEAEFYWVWSAVGTLVGVGSDHTDRQRESIDVAESKALCSKVLSAHVWTYDDVVDHWDALQISSWVTVAGDRRLHQQGTLGELMSLQDLTAELRGAGYAELDGHVVFGGTLPTLNGFVSGERFECRLDDPVLGRSLTCSYCISVE